MALNKRDRRILAIAAIIGAIILVYLLVTNNDNGQVAETGDGQQPDTTYLTFNQPPTSGGGPGYPGGSVAGNQNTYGGINLNNSTGGCCGCDSPSYYGTASTLASSLGNSGASNTDSFVSGLPPYYNISVNGSDLAGNSTYAPSYLTLE